MLRVCHWGPLIALSIILTVTFSTTYSALQLWSLPPSIVRYFRKTNFYLMYLWLVPIFWNFFMAMRGPGFVPLGWIPQRPEDEKYLQYCRICRGFKPPRSHHCKKCKRCVTKMDHHCPWINTCVGHANHTSFMWFLFFVPFGCIHGMIVNANFLYRLLDYQFSFYPHYLPVTTGWIFFAVTGISFGAGTALGVIILFLTQLKGIILNKTQIEEWIIEKAKHRRRVSRGVPPFVFPYSLGCLRNIWQVLNIWGYPLGDGINWEVKEGVDKYALTVEQLEQKKLKKERAVTCRVKKGYGGYRCPIFSFGVMTSMCAPCCVEGFIKVEKGDVITITRWERKWVYGDKVLSKVEVNAGKQVKGWFPRACIHPVSIQYTPNDLPYDSQASDTQVSTHSDSQYSQLSESEQDSPIAATGERKKKKKSHSSDECSPKRSTKSLNEAPRVKKSSLKDVTVGSSKEAVRKEMVDLQKMASSESPKVLARRRKK